MNLMDTSQRMGFCFTLLLAILVMAFGQTLGHAAEPAEVAPVPFRLALQWLPQSQFAGYYMARDKGFFEQEGMRVTLIHAGPGPSSLDELHVGKADLATLLLSDGIREADGDQPLVLVTQVVQKSNLLLVAWKDRGIQRPSDLNGRRISLWPGTFGLAFDLFFRLQGIEASRIPQHYSVSLFLNRGVDACAAMSYNEWHRMAQAGVDAGHLTVFARGDYGLGYPEDGFYTTPAFFRDHSSLMPGFARAVLAGWRYARDHRQEAIATVLRESREAGVPANAAHARWMLDGMVQAIFEAGDGQKPGVLRREDFLRCARDLKREGMIRALPAFEGFTPLGEGS